MTKNIAVSRYKNRSRNKRPVLSFKGECEAAFKYYEKVLGAKLGLLFSYANSPMADIVPDGWENKIMHGSVRIGGSLIEGAE